MRTAIVTGGTRGIGRAIAARLAADGWDVVAAARSTAALPAGVRFARCDVADAASVAALFAGLERLDALVNNAGFAGAEASWHEIVATNLTGTWLCCEAARGLLPENAGRIVNIASVLGLRGAADQPAYAAAKHGVIGLTRSLALALAPRGITVNAVCPGWVRTEMAERRFAELGITEREAGVPQGRIAEPAEVAALVAFLLSPDAGHLTGEAVVLDGGRMAAP
jgi:NAD(P)-dependent dehydrogenase (short-subunit alcohol dehydrogenase family)